MAGADRGRVRAAYGALAGRYIELFADQAAVHVDDRAVIARHLRIRPGIVLDVGCGPGHLTGYLRSAGVDATGIDLTPEFIDHARLAHPDSPFEVGSMGHLPHPDRSIAGILAWYSLIHVPPEDLDEVLDELRRVITPGGTLVAGFFDGDEVADFAHQVVTASFWPVDEFAARLRQAGFAEIERHQRRGDADVGVRDHAAIVAVAD